MPITLPPITRRRFLAGALAAGAAPLVGARAQAVPAAQNAARFALLADTHMAADTEQVVRGTNMAANLRQVVGEILADADGLHAAMINGDCALTRGETEDYRTLIKLLDPLRGAGRAVHMTLGNHDHRERFLAAVPAAIGQPSALDGRYATVIESPLVNWFLLDSLDVTNQTPGRLGDEQLAWLAGALDERTERPAIVLTHHHPSRVGAISGLIDTPALMDVIVPRGQVKALVFGHTHHWRVREEEGIHLVNLPPVAYPFIPTDPSGWVLAQLDPQGARLRLNSIDPAHAAHGQEVDIRWRTT